MELIHCYFIVNELDPNINPQPGKKFPFDNIPPRLYVVIILFVVFFTYQILGGLISLSFVDMEDPAAGDKNLLRTVTAFSQFMFMLFPVLMLSYLQGNRFDDVFKIKKPKASIMFLSILGIILIQPAIEAYMYFQNKLIYSLPLGETITTALKEMDKMFEELTLKLVASYSIPELLVVLFVIAVTPAICEEFFFRGLVLKNFERAFKAAPAILYTGILFAIFHFHPLNIIPLILLGYFLTFIVHYSGSIFTGIVAHFINNSLAVLAIYFIGAENISEEVLSQGDETSMLIYGIVSLILFVLVLRLMKKISLSSQPQVVPELTAEEVIEEIQDKENSEDNE